MKLLNFIRENWFLVTETAVLIGVFVNWVYVKRFKQKADGLKLQMESDDEVVDRMERLNETLGRILEEKATLLIEASEMRQLIVELKEQKESLDRELKKATELITELEDLCDCVKDALSKK